MSKTLSQAIAARGLDERREVALMKRRMRDALRRDRVKVFASTPLGSIPVFGRRADGQYTTVHDIHLDLLTLKNVDLVSTSDYVAAWCRLNHLVA